jgi:hypothetical protein
MQRHQIDLNKTQIIALQDAIEALLDFGTYADPETLAYEHGISYAKARNVFNAIHNSDFENVYAQLSMASKSFGFAKTKQYSMTCSFEIISGMDYVMEALHNYIEDDINLHMDMFEEMFGSKNAKKIVGELEELMTKLLEAAAIMKEPEREITEQDIVTIEML